MKHTCLFFMVLLIFSTKVSAQQAKSTQLQRFSRNAALFNINYTQEKVYLHFDNTGYFLGENIWFKAYVVNATSTKPTDMSKTLYVDLLTQEGDILEHHLVELNNGMGSGSLMLQDSLPGGFYEVRAYTRAMRNFGDEVVFSRVFPVYDKPSIDGNYNKRIMTERHYRVQNCREKLKEDNALNLTFYPEGGNLVQGIASRVAFIATDRSGNGVEVSGALMDKSNRELTALQSVHQGMGSFVFTPNGDSYKAKLRYNEKNYTFELPKADTLGYVIGLEQVAEKDSQRLMLHVQRSANIQEDTLAVSFMCRGKLIDFRLLTIPQKGCTIDFPTGRLQEGVHQITLYAADGRVLADRLLFVRQQKAAQSKRPDICLMNVSTDKKAYKPFEKIVLNLQVKDTATTNTGTSISLAVRDAASSNFAGPDNPDIATTLLLASDIKGYVANPRWYFEKDEQQRNKALDLLMLTQGWRRYKWERMEGLEPFKPVQPIEEGIVVDGG